MKTVFTHTFQYLSCPVQCVCINGMPWLKGEDVATILIQYADALEAIRIYVDPRDRKTAEELLGPSGQGCTLNENSDFLCFPGIDSLIKECERREEGAEFEEWIWSEIVPVARALPVHRPVHQGCSDDEEEEKLPTRGEEKLTAKDVEDYEEWCDFSTNRNPKYWLRKFNKTALMKECDKRGVIVDNPMMTLNVVIIKALIDADTI